MIETIEKLLILQERDRQLGRLEAELASIPPQRQTKERRADEAAARLEAARAAAMKIETRRQELEVEVEGIQEQIQRYSLQQFQTKKNDEYQALGREIERSQRRIRELEDQQLELMEQGERAQEEVARLAEETHALQAEVRRQLADLATRERNLRARFEELRAGRETLARDVDEGLVGRYERLRKTKGDRVVVGIDRGICGGCHMKLQPHLLLACKTGRQVVTCSSCSRILYYDPGMTV
jgi:predicted  nucleic acid-binding Zn-ribbon protein